MLHKNLELSKTTTTILIHFNLFLSNLNFKWFCASTLNCLIIILIIEKVSKVCQKKKKRFDLQIYSKKLYKELAHRCKNLHEHLYHLTSPSEDLLVHQKI